VTGGNRWSFVVLGTLPTATAEAAARREVRALVRLLDDAGCKSVGAAAFPPLEVDDGEEAGPDAG
jgi:hypothetical protein